MPGPIYTPLNEEFKKLEEATLALHRALKEEGRKRRMTPEPIEELAALHQAKSELISAVVNSCVEDQRLKFEGYVFHSVREAIKECKQEIATSQAAARELLLKSERAEKE